MEYKDLVKNVNALINDKKFLTLKSLQSKSNLFEIVAASHTEMWHSAFIKWILDPNSSLGLGTYPLRRFLYMVLYEGKKINPNPSLKTLDLSVIEGNQLNLEDMIFQTEFTDKNLKGRIDIIGMNDETIRLTIENKVSSKESSEQTIKYQKYLEQSAQNFQYDIMVFLSPDDKKEPSSKEFIQVNYQQLCDQVLKPCLEHPEINNENKFLILQYLSNLRKPLKKGGVGMANPNKELCESIYESYKDVLDEIYQTVNGKAPESRSRAEQIKRYNITLGQLIDEKMLSLRDTLQAKYKEKEYKANLMKDNGFVKIKLNDVVYDNPSQAAKTITENNVNGWVFWSVYDENNQLKGSLSELRENMKIEELEEVETE